MLHEVNLSTARNLSPLFDEAVRREQPVLITRGKRERGLLLSRDALLRLLAAYTFHVDVIPEDEGGFTLWLKELEVGGTGTTFPAARQQLLAAAKAYAADYIAQFDLFRHLPDKASQEPYILRLSVAADDHELAQMLFGSASSAARAQDGASTAAASVR